MSRLASSLVSRTLPSAMETAVKTWTEEELMRFPHEGCKCELVDDELRLTRAGMDHALIGASLAAQLGDYVATHRLGIVCGPNLGCWMRSGNLRCADVSFIGVARTPRTAAAREGFFRGAPDLVVEIVESSDRPQRIGEKLAEYFASGARLAWVIDPAEKSAVAYRSPEQSRLLHVTDVLDGDDVLPGFRLPLAELFAELLLD